MSIDYVQEKLYEAVYVLLGAGSIQERLQYAGQALVTVGDGRGLERHPELADRFGAAYRSLSRGALGPEGAIQATTSRLTDEEGSKLAREIFSLFCRASELAHIPTGFEDLGRGDGG